METYYERHQHPNPQFPFIFHATTISHSTAKGNVKFSVAHWHENIELLHFVSGSGTVFSNMVHYPVEAGDIAIINSNKIHTLYFENSHCKYYCLIVDSSFCNELDIAVEELEFSPIIRDSDANNLMNSIIFEMESASDYYHQSVKSLIIALLVQLCRNHLPPNTYAVTGKDSRKAAMVKAGIRVIRQRYKQHLTIDDICDNIGFSKYYFCRAFKEYTGNTVVDYINYLRCRNAQSLIRSGTYNISESARASGIQNISYFSKIYKRYMGVSPAEDKP